LAVAMHVAPAQLMNEPDEMIATLVEIFQEQEQELD
jgi:hypothetical protein